MTCTLKSIVWIDRSIVRSWNSTKLLAVQFSHATKTNVFPQSVYNISYSIHGRDLALYRIPDKWIQISICNMFTWTLYLIVFFSLLARHSTELISNEIIRTLHANKSSCKCSSYYCKPVIPTLDAARSYRLAIVVCYYSSLSAPLNRSTDDLAGHLFSSFFICSLAALPSFVIHCFEVHVDFSTLSETRRGMDEGWDSWLMTSMHNIHRVTDDMAVQYSIKF